MRMATFNTLHGRSSTDGEVQLDRFAAAIASLDADVLALQEVDRDQPRSLGADLTAVAAEAMQARDRSFAAAMVGPAGRAWRAATGREAPGVAAYGVALLSRYPVSDWRVVRLPALRAWVPLWSQPRRFRLVKDEARVGLIATIESPLGRLCVAATHLSYLSVWNSIQLKKLMKTLYQVSLPLVLLGDLNMEPGRARKLTAMRPLASGLTFPADRPSRQIDHILARGLEVAGPSSAIKLPVSDHLALAVDIAV
jgi:endonuclease/exonuclease/phosphatase family metal-dependent hydrolase